MGKEVQTLVPLPAVLLIRTIFGPVPDPFENVLIRIVT
jgi:hypothetical protein